MTSAYEVFVCAERPGDSVSFTSLAGRACRISLHGEQDQGGNSRRRRRFVDFGWNPSDAALGTCQTQICNATTPTPSAVHDSRGWRLRGRRSSALSRRFARAINERVGSVRIMLSSLECWTGRSCWHEVRFPDFRRIGRTLEYVINSAVGTPRQGHNLAAGRSSY